MSFQLREYQNEVLQIIQKHHRAGLLSQLINMAPGAGKTEVFVRLHDYLGLKKRIMILVHRDFLAKQAADKLMKFNPAISMGIEMATQTCRETDKFVICSVSTVGRKDSKRLSKFKPEDFDLIISDECHHAVSPQWNRILEYFDVLPKQENKHKILSLGVTATVPRLDKKCVVGGAFKKIVYELGIVELIELGYLVPPIAYKIETDIDVSGCKSNSIDFIASDLDRLINVAKRNELIFTGYKKYLGAKGDRKLIKTIGFAHSVQHAKDLAALFTSRGVKCTYIIAETPYEERSAIFKKFNADGLDVIFNVGTLTEGLDLPICGGILYCKCTLSWALYYQSVTRALRMHEGKDKAIIVDFYDSSDNHSLISAPTIFGAPGTLDCKGEDVLTVVKELKDIVESNPWFDPSTVKNIDEARLVSRECYNLWDLRKQSNSGNFSQFFWCKMGDGSFRLMASHDQILSIKRTGNVLSGKYNLFLNKEIIHPDVDLKTAFRRGDAFIRTNVPEEKQRIMRVKGDWVHRMPGEKQTNFLRKSKVSQEVINRLTRGSAYKLICKIIMADALRDQFYIN